MDTLLLSRIQFGANISFHILFPTITIALGWVLLFFKLRFNATRDPKWMEAYGFWVKVFALTFALGVVSGITMSFQFGTNWPGFMETVGNVAGPLLAYEVLTAFFLEAGFLGIMLFGATRVPGWLHTLATVLVAFGTTLSAFWIIVLNSWMHTPQGYELRDGVVHATDWMQIVFNPSMPYRLTHMLLASGLTVAFLIQTVLVIIPFVFYCRGWVMARSWYDDDAQFVREFIPPVPVAAASLALIATLTGDWGIYLLTSTLALFALALLASGFASASVGTLSGQIVMEGFLDVRLPPWLRRLATRLVAIAPAIVVTLAYGERGAAKLLILSQVVLSLQLPFAIAPLILIVSNRTKMGELRAPAWLIAAAVMTAALIVALNVKLVFDFVASQIG